MHLLDYQHFFEVFQMMKIFIKIKSDYFEPTTSQTYLENTNYCYET